MIQAPQHGGRLAALLAVACLGLGYLSYQQIEDTSAGFSAASADVAQAGRPRAAQTSEDDGFDAFDEDLADSGLESLAAYDEISDRPLFDPSRRPIESDPKPEPERTAVRANSNDFVLQGTTSAPEGRKALVMIRSSRQRLWVAEGEQLNGWLIERIAPDGVTLTRAGRSEQLTLKDQPSLRRKVSRPSGPPRGSRETARQPASGNSQGTGEQQDRVQDNAPPDGKSPGLSSLGTRTSPQVDEEN